MRRDWVAILGIVLVVLGMGILGYPDASDTAIEDDQTIVVGQAIDHHPIYQCGPSWRPPIEQSYANFVQWSPDGTFLVFNYDQTVWAVDDAGIWLRKIVDANPGYLFQYGYQSDVSPDGMRIVYATCEYTNDAFRGDKDPRASHGYEIGIVNVDGTGRQRLTNNASFENYPAWSPDGGRIAFVAGPHLDPAIRIDRYIDLYTMAADGTDTQLVASFRQTGGSSLAKNQAETRPTAIAFVPPVWSPNEELLAFLARVGSIDNGWNILYSVRDDGTGLLRIAEKVVSVPAWSPDGRHLAYARFFGNVVSLFTVAADGSNEELITTITSKNGFMGDYYRSWISTVSWSPDGTKLLYTCGVGACIVNVEDSRHLELPLRLISWKQPVVSAWSPDGERVALYDTDSGRVITLAPDGTDPRGLVWLEKARHKYGELAAWNAPRIQARVDVSVCAAGSVVPEPEANPGLVRDCETLLELRDTLGGRTYLDWLGGIPISRWQGVTLGGTPPRVHYLDLVGAQLTGTLPPQLGQLTELRGLNVANVEWEYLPRVYNGLTGSIPPELGNLSKLEYLLLANNFLSGEIPPELGNLTNLRRLTLGLNYLTGSIPAELGRLTELETLDLGYNRLHGSIPPELAALQQLQGVSHRKGLFLRDNDLSGCVAAELPDIWVEASGLERCA